MTALAANHCWNCGARLDADDCIRLPRRPGQRLDPIVVCSARCARDVMGESYTIDTIDLDQQDRNAAAAERIDNLRRER